MYFIYEFYGYISITVRAIEYWWGIYAMRRHGGCPRKKSTACKRSSEPPTYQQATCIGFLEMKRSVSPQATFESTPKKRKFLGLGLFSSLKRVFSRSELEQPPVPSYQPFGSFEQDDLPAEFSSQKRRMSVQENIHQRSTAIPRTSVVGINGYQALTKTLEAERQMTKAGLEQLRSTFVSPALNSAEFLAQLDYAKDSSPSSNIYPRNQMLPTNPMEMELGDDNAELPIVVEHDFAPLYTDEAGNLVRPPFINLDPRERYNLLQLKKSMEASKFLQDRTKYMVDPDETTSITRPDNRVDSATQTHDKDFLDRSLHFTNLRTKLALRNRRNRRSNGRGVVSGLFYYEPTKKEVEGSTDEGLSGYLGKLSRPKFSEPTKEIPAKGFADDASSAIITKRRKSVGQRAGLDESIRLGKIQDGSVDKDYLEKTERVSNIIKLKETTTPAKKTVGPSSGFTFDVDLNAISSILKKRQEDDENVAKSMSSVSNPVEKVPSSLFGKSDEKAVSNSASKFSFGKTESVPKISSEDSHTSLKYPSSSAESAPTISFGSSESASKTVSRDEKDSAFKFSFGNKSAAPVAFGKDSTAASNSTKENGEAEPREKRKRTADEEKPSSSLGSKPAAATSALFSASSTAEHPKFSFGTKTAESFASTSESNQSGFPTQTGVADDTAGATAGTKFAFGNKKDAPSFSFGQSDSTLKSSTTEKDSAPKFSFSQNTETPKLSFGEKKQDPSKDVPQFTFKAQPADKPASEPPAFSFGVLKEAPKFSLGSLKPEEPTKLAAAEPKFSFGKTKPETVSKLSFGSTPASKENTAMVPQPSFLFGLEQKPATAGLFGNGGAKESTPAFSFSSKETTPKPSAGPAAGGFSFGSSNQPAQPQASATSGGFSFGQSALVDPAKIFGASGNAPQPAFNFSASKEATPFTFGASAPTAPAASAAPAKPSGFSFSSNVTGAFGNSRPSTPSGFGLNGPTSNIAAPTPQFSGFNAGTSAPGFNTSSGGTPFGANPNPNPNAGQSNGFSFTPNAMGAAVGFNSAPGSFGAASRENTPPVGFGQPGSAPGQPFTPPLAMQGRKFAQMRPRKRF